MTSDRSSGDIAALFSDIGAALQAGSDVSTLDALVTLR
jgi:hypothetical protein